MRLKNFIPIAILLTVSLFSQTHFTPVWSGFPLQVFAVYVNTATIDGGTLQAGDEIGVFDGGVCVGAAALAGEMTATVTLFTAADDPATPGIIDGYLTGNPVAFRLWDDSTALELTWLDVDITSGSDSFLPYGFCNVNLAAAIIAGCTDPAAINYNPEAVIDDGSCVYAVFGCLDPEACNYDPGTSIDDGSCLYWDCAGDCGGTAYENECGCVGGGTGLAEDWCYGCTDPFALNYDPALLIDDGSCAYPNGDANGDGIRNVVDVILLVDIALNPENYAFLFWMDLNDDTFINILDIVMLVEWVLYPELVGCTNPCTGNYNPAVLYDDGSCIFGDMAADYDGNCYETVQIGGELWLAENLKVTHYNNGDPIPTGYSDFQWVGLSTGAYAVYDDDPVLGETYGNL